MAMRITSDLGRVKARLKITGELVTAEAMRQMEKEAYEIQNLARDYAPLEKGNLMEAIQARRTRGKSGWVIEIDEGKPDDTGRYTVGDYAIRLHEDTSWTPGPLTIWPRGPKYLERAYLERAKNLMRRMRDAVRRGLKRGESSNVGS
jgi:hypothetical protein